jgi:putative transposase
MDNTNTRRRSIRLPEYDYTTPNAYFIALCTAERRCLFGRIVEGTMHLNAVGRIVEEE